MAADSSPAAGAASLCLLAASGLSLARLSASLSSSEARCLPAPFADPASAERHVSWQRRAWWAAVPQGENKGCRTSCSP